MKTKLYKDTVHELKARCRSRSMAWALIRNECRRLNLKVPTMDQIVEIK